jgi:membrane protein DedA with SNARE-associated domain
MVSLSDGITIVGTLVATFAGAWLGFVTARRQDEKRQEKLHEALRGALLAEAGKLHRRGDSIASSRV